MSDYTSPVITVLMSCYNGAMWLGEAIESVLNQTFGDYEFIIVDDGSRDNSLEIINSFASKDVRIVVISKENSGLADSLNIGIQAARGEWVARLDADDVCDPTRLQKQLSRAKDNPNLVFLGSGLQIIDEFGVSGDTYLYPEDHKHLLKNLSSGQKFPAHSSAFFCRSKAIEVGGYRSRIKRAEDCDLWLRLAEIGELGSIHEPLVMVRKHAAQISHDDYGKRQIIDAHMAMISYWLRRSGAPDPIMADDRNFEFFSMWVADQLEEEHFFDFMDYSRNLKKFRKKFFCNKVVFYINIKNMLSNPMFFIRYLHTRFFGYNTSIRLANEWKSGN